MTSKLRKDLVAYILNEKSRNQSISCRDISAKINEKFGVFVSKSSVNSLLKSNNLSGPKGRRRKQLLVKSDKMSNGCFYFLVALDYFFGFSGTASDLLIELSPLPKRVSKIDCESTFRSLLLHKLIYGVSDDLTAIYNNGEIWKIIGYRPDRELFNVIISNFNNLQSFSGRYFERLKKNVTQIFNFQFVLADQSSFFSDAEFFTFSRGKMKSKNYITYYNAISYINNQFVYKKTRKQKTFKFFNLMGNSICAQEVLDIFRFFDGDGEHLRLGNINLLNGQNSIVDSISVKNFKKGTLFIGFWPWQFDNIYTFESKVFHRKIHNQKFGIDFYYSIEPFEFPQTIVNKRFKLNIVLLKNAPNSAVRFGIITNADQKNSLNFLLESDLIFWASPEEKFENFKKDIPLASGLTPEKQLETLSFSKTPIQNTVVVEICQIIDEVANFLVEYFRKNFIFEECQNWNWLKIKDVFLRQNLLLERRKSIVICNIFNSNMLCKIDYLNLLCRKLNELRVFDQENRPHIFTFSRENQK